MTVVQHLTAWFAPWQSAYSDSKVLSTSVTTIHLLALFIGGGFAVAADRLTLRLTRPGSRATDADRMRQLVDLHEVHKPVVIALGVLFVSGLLLAAADIETFVPSPIFWVKMGLVAVLMANGGVLQLAERALYRRPTTERTDVETARLWRRLRRSAGVSVAMWTATVVAGAILVNA
jgi:hypothetical protein